MTVAIAQDVRDQIKKICAVFVPDAAVYVFGSRATGKSDDRSDIDIALLSKEAIPLKVIYQLKNVFTNSDIPQRIDVIDLNAVTPDFRAAIEKEMVEL